MAALDGVMIQTKAADLMLDTTIPLPMMAAVGAVATTVEKEPTRTTDRRWRTAADIASTRWGTTSLATADRYKNHDFFAFAFDGRAAESGFRRGVDRSSRLRVPVRPRYLVFVELSAAGTSGTVFTTPDRETFDRIRRRLICLTATDGTVTHHQSGTRLTFTDPDGRTHALCCPPANRCQPGRGRWSGPTPG